MEKWRFIDTGSSSPAMNMAIDEAMLLIHSQGKTKPSVRFYTWNPATLSIGYFQKAATEINLDKVKEYGLGFVRRATGGRAVLHDKELTYSLIVCESHPAMPSTVTDAYRVISVGLLEGFKAIGLDAMLADPHTDKEKFAVPSSSACFDAPSDYELIVEGKKVAGSAQTRQKGVILQHGSILLDMDANMLFDVINLPNEKVKERLKKNFLDKAVAINDVRSQPLSVEEAKKAFRLGFSKGLGVELVDDELTEEERELAEQLCQEKYGSDAWNFKR
ncbi:biotin/lipoate A/B protein ligase family protein [Aneurinibacillus sp. Ricciae_BoGa-3]|uniref:lipoate--protein ligase family protein n=1 Tax=Aneurinibacillus sp. Ricciae_BoGa-3 TaxID=3022697 RepID=UPI002341AB8A|nr:biotin/lipoate A/B protein ligase family protein [Aneurinibacillus sp. Ricciae_BoGa-3]WCK53335.1 biotin/lipoate A/B protein ligase family protein [Aneurinibacillus sp. Ricciae_BoGa-3]